MIWLVLIAVHDKCHTEGKNENFAVLQVIDVAPLRHHVEKAFQCSWHHVESKLWPPWSGFKKYSEAADETGYDHVPSVDLLSGILRQTEHVTEYSDIDSKEERRLDDVFKSNPECLFWSARKRLDSNSLTLLQALLVWKAGLVRHAAVCRTYRPCWRCAGTLAMHSTRKSGHVCLCIQENHHCKDGLATTSITF